MTRKLWRYITGEKGVNRIRVYERRPGGPISVEWYDREGRHQQSLTRLSGVPLLADSEENRELAKELADRMAAAQRRAREADQAHKLLGLPAPRTLGQLLQRYEDDHPDWSPGHKRDQVVNRRYWEERIGADRLLTSISPSLAANIIETDAARIKKGFSPRTQEKRIRYLKDAFNYARRHLKWIDEKDDLAALKTPSTDGDSKPYSREEVQKILLASNRVDRRCAAAAYIAAVSGRRLDAIRTLPASAYRAMDFEGEPVGVISFPGETDKARRTGQVYFVGQAKEAIERLLETPAVQATGNMFPSGDLEDPKPRKVRVSQNTLRDMLREAEELAGVESIEGRAYHGFKRRFATEALRLDPQAASKQAGTTLEMLRKVYEQDDPEVKIALAKSMNQTLGGAK